MTTDAGSGFDNQAASRDAGTNLDEIEEESRHVADDDAGEAAGDEVSEAADDEEHRERKQVEDQINEAF